MANVVIRHNIRAYANLRSSDGVIKTLEQAAKRIAQRANSRIAGDGYRTSSRQGYGRAPRWRTTVITASAEAMRDNAKNNTLVREMGRGGAG